MALHRTSGRWRLGLALAFVPAVLWGALPLALKIVLQHMDGATIAWYRFTGSALILCVALAAHRRLPAARSLARTDAWLLVLASVGLAGNYLCWILGLRFVSPATASVVVQITPLFLAAGAMLIFGERFNAAQWLGFVVLFVGLALFSQDKLAALAHGAGQYWQGVALTAFSGFSWVFYALSQKQLLRKLPSPAIMLLVYTGCALLLLSVAHPAQALRLDATSAVLLLFCVGNTLIAYGALSEAFEHWEASRVSAVLTLSPLFTLLFMHIVTALWPGRLEPERLHGSGYLGAALVVAGSMATALSGQGRAPEALPAEA
ncbi:MAG: DMT family transporter [Armatimonadetes bacterium]|nr:DMT family transporter [Armatimonadota bacterium]